MSCDIICCVCLVQMIREKKLERRRQRRKATEQLQPDQEADTMTMSPSYTSDHQQELVDNVMAKQHSPDADVDHVQRRRRRRRPKQASVDDENSEKYENGWPVTKSESEHLAGALNNTDLLASRSEPIAPSVTPHSVHKSMSTPTADTDVVMQPVFLQKLNNDFDVVSKPYYLPHQSTEYFNCFPKCICC